MELRCACFQIIFLSLEFSKTVVQTNASSLISLCDAGFFCAVRSQSYVTIIVLNASDILYEVLWHKLSLGMLEDLMFTNFSFGRITEFSGYRLVQ